MVDDDIPPNAVLTELGALTWEAIRLEDAVYALCDAIDLKDEILNRPFVSQRIEVAKKTLRGVSDESLRLRALDWLGNAGEALRERNALLHSVPYLFKRLPGTTEIPGAPMQHLVYYPKGDVERSKMFSLTVSSLRPVRRRLRTAREGGLELAFAIWNHAPEEPS